tara:strand:+ start:1831 stop:2478 length:648 start_codon:yes stop_codon:yes gene_type:complete
MNIFVVDYNPHEAAKALCDIHVNKMIVESMQMLTTALKQSGILAADELPFRKDGITRYSGNAHPHHPCTKWVGEHLDKPTFPNPYETFPKTVETVRTWEAAGDSGLTIATPNYSWLYFHTKELLLEYQIRYGKTHGCFDAFDALPEGSHEAWDCVDKFVQTMPDEFKIEEKYPANIEKAYRQFYHTKSFAKWAKGRDAPNWWMQPLADLVGQVEA